MQLSPAIFSYRVVK